MKKIKEWVKNNKTELKVGALTVGTAVVCAGLTYLCARTFITIKATQFDICKTDDVETVLDFLTEKGNSYTIQDLGDVGCVWVEKI